MRRMAGLYACLLAANAGAAIVHRDEGATLERIAPDVFAIIHDDATDEWPHGNTGVVIGRDGVLVIDSTYLPSRARADIALIRRVTDKPVRYLVYTHWHFDHNNGGAEYRRAFPQISIVSERATRSYIDVNSHWWAQRSARPDQPKHTALKELEQQFPAADGKSRAELQAKIQRRRNELNELAQLKVELPDTTFVGELTLDLGGRTVEIRDWGRANSPHDVTVYVPDSKVLFAGDILVQSPVPYFTESWPVAWSQVLQSIERIPVRAIVPGHGPVLPDHSYTHAVRQLIDTTIGKVTALARAGRTLEEIQRDLDLSDTRTRVPAWNTPERDEDWGITTRTLIERVWRGVRGQGGV